MVEYSAAIIMAGTITIWRAWLVVIDRLEGLFFIYKIMLGLSPSYLQGYLNSYYYERSFHTWSSIQMKTDFFYATTKSFEISFYNTAIKNGVNLARKLEIHSINKFTSSVFNIISPRENLIFAVHYINGVKLSIYLRLNFSHLSEHKFQHNFNIINPCWCMCWLHYFLQCDLHSLYRLELLNYINILMHHWKTILKIIS